MKISVITINYNNSVGLDKTIASVVDQSFRDYEFIIIDGGSTDGSVDVIKKYESKISYWVSEKDKGIYNAQNKGIKAAKGEYLLFLNSGDYLADSEVFTKIFSKNITADIAYGNMFIIHPDGRKEEGYMPAEITFYQMITDTLWHPVSFIKKELFEKYGGYNEDYKIVADYEFFVNVLIDKKVSTHYLNQFISAFILDGKSSLAENVETIRQERKKAQLKYFHPSMIELAHSYRDLNSSGPATQSLKEKIKALFKKP